MSMRAVACLLLVLACVATTAVTARADEAEQKLLTIEQAPGAVFPDADRFERRDVPLTPELRTAIQARMGSVKPSLWEATLVTFTAHKGDGVLGYAVVLEEIGKHRPITSIVGVTPEGKVQDVAVMVYREAYGGEVGSRRFLGQYPGSSASDPLASKIKNVAGATLSVAALNRTVTKGIAAADVLYLHPDAAAGAAPQP
ncbi:FMN-binding protein [Candidatus Binatia bacterium]|nr:FMN-binding protein [Candidatus Binatia bacterium]